jgi:ABC-type multidrug transport system fused ATPase/permease subunit
MSELNLRAYRNEVGMALQDSIPFAATLSENIGYLRQDASEAEIWAAAKAAGLHDQVVRLGADAALSAETKKDPAKKAVLESLSQRVDLGSLRSADEVLAAAGKAGALDDVARLGYLARVGERGVNLSGGQKQRLMLAQVFLQPDKPFGLMIYDEPTSALDGRTQALIEEQILARRGRTTQIVIAHRLSNVQRADRIVVFQDGAIVEQGTHDDLMRAGGVYAKMWDAQRLLDAAAGHRAE